MREYKIKFTDVIPDLPATEYRLVREELTLAEACSLFEGLGYRLKGIELV